MLLLETDYRIYIIFYMQNIKNGTMTQVLALYGNPNICLGFPATSHGRVFHGPETRYGMVPRDCSPNKESQICPQGATYHLTRHIWKNLKTSANCMG